MEENKLNLGCGYDYKDGFVNLDIVKDIKADVHHDMTQFPYPFNDDYFDYIYTIHTLEHFTGKELMDILPELYRISKNKAKWYIRIPYFTYASSQAEILHRQNFSSTSFDLFKPTCYDWGYQLYKPIRLNIVSVNIIFGRLHKLLGLQWFFNKKKYLYEAMFCYIFPAREIEYFLEVVKENKR